MALVYSLFCLVQVAHAQCYCPDNYQDQGNNTCLSKTQPWLNGSMNAISCTSVDLTGTSWINGALVFTSTGLPIPPDWKSGDTAPVAAAICYCPVGYEVIEVVTDNGKVSQCVKNASIFLACSATPITATVATTSVTAALNATSTVAASTIEATAVSSTGLQSTALKVAGDTMLTGANNRATVALIGCAAGANEELDSAGSGTGNVADCQDNFAKADELAKMAGKTGKNAKLSPDSSVIGSEIGQTTLAKFEKNFGVSQEDYVSRMLASHGARAEFEDMLKAKFSDDRVEKLMTAAAETAPSEDKTSSVSSNQPFVSKKKVDTSLRDSIKAKLASGRDLASLKNGAEPGARVFKAINLQPSVALDKIMFGNEEQDSGLTIFEVVTQKIRELTAKQRL
jgi:hypothetical protein